MRWSVPIPLHGCLLEEFNNLNGIMADVETNSRPNSVIMKGRGHSNCVPSMDEDDRLVCAEGAVLMEQEAAVAPVADNSASSTSTEDVYQRAVTYIAKHDLGQLFQARAVLPRQHNSQVQCGTRRSGARPGVLLGLKVRVRISH